MITAHSPSAESSTDLSADAVGGAPPQAVPSPSPQAAPAAPQQPATVHPGPSAVPRPDAPLAPAIDLQAQRVDQLSAAILRATAQLSWSGRAADRFRDRASERARECLQLAVALRASADRIHAASKVSDTRVEKPQ